VISLISNTILELFDNKGYTVRTPNKGAKSTLYCRSDWAFTMAKSLDCNPAEVAFDMVYGIMDESGSAEDLQKEGLKSALQGET
jgi:hypothetical protein